MAYLNPSRTVLKESVKEISSLMVEYLRQRTSNLEVSIINICSCKIITSRKGSPEAQLRDEGVSECDRDDTLIVLSQDVERSDGHLTTDHLQISLQARCLAFYLVYWSRFERGEVLPGPSSDVQLEGAVGAVSGGGEEESIESKDLLLCHIFNYDRVGNKYRCEHQHRMIDVFQDEAQNSSIICLQMCMAWLSWSSSCLVCLFLSLGWLRRRSLIPLTAWKFTCAPLRVKRQSRRSLFASIFFINTFLLCSSFFSAISNLLSRYQFIFVWKEVYTCAFTMLTRKQRQAKTREMTLLVFAFSLRKFLNQALTLFLTSLPMLLDSSLLTMVMIVELMFWDNSLASYLLASLPSIGSCSSSAMLWDGYLDVSSNETSGMLFSSSSLWSSNNSTSICSRWLISSRHSSRVTDILWAPGYSSSSSMLARWNSQHCLRE